MESRQLVKVTIRWTDLNGDVVGAAKEIETDLPKWGKWEPMRKLAQNMLDDLLRSLEAHSKTSVVALRDYILDAFSLDSIINITCRTRGSHFTLKDKPLKDFIERYKESKNESTTA